MAQKRTRRPDRVPESVTVFNVCVFYDREISSQPLVLLVRNIADSEARKLENPLDPLSSASKKKGKPAGWGLPGGGVKADDLETPKDAAVTEFRDETGVVPKKVQEIPFEPPVTKLITLDKDGEMVSFCFFEKGKRPSIELSRGQSAIENPLYFFAPTIDWGKTYLRKLLLESADNLIVRGTIAKEDMDLEGISIKLAELTPEEVASLGIVERLGNIGREEIDAIGVFPLDMLLEGSLPGLYKTHQVWLGMAAEKLNIPTGAA